MVFSLKNRKVLLTGATGGIGQAIARLLHSQGASIVLVGRSKEKLEALCKSLGDSRALFLTCDMDDSQALGSLIQEAEAKLGGLDTLINNAGTTKDGLMVRMKTQDFESVLSVNLKAPFILMQNALKTMMKERFGRIINISSVVGFTGNPGQANYTASKAGLVAMSKTVALEMASRGITVNCIAPGYIQTPMTDAINEDQKKALLQHIPLKEIGKPEDIAYGVLYLASNEAHYVTGQTLHINGGMFML